MRTGRRWTRLEMASVFSLAGRWHRTACSLPRGSGGRPWTALRSGVGCGAVQTTRRLLSDTVSSPASVSRRDRILGLWLLGCCGMVGGAVVVGGITRLTEAGLSMTQWHLIKGMKPPRSEKEWEEEFEKYKQYPEYKHVHQDITMEGYKKIFYLEYFHRMWARTTGLAIMLPAAFFWARGWLSPGMKKRAGVYTVLVLLQGLYGWYMVKSGLREKQNPHEVPRVSQYRLAGHLSVALILYSSMWYTALGLLFPPTIAPAVAKVKQLRYLTHGAVAAVFFTCVSGAFVAGLDAGLVYNSFPKMAGRWIPDDLTAMTPKTINVFENPTTVQFNHRWLGTAALAYVVGVWALARGAPLPRRARLATNALAATAFLQVGLGIATLLTFVPTSLASSHQAGAVSLLTIALWLMHELRKKLPRT